VRIRFQGYNLGSPGVAAALILTAAGVSRDIVVADYLLSNEYLVERVARWRAADGRFTGPTRHHTHQLPAGAGSYRRLSKPQRPRRAASEVATEIVICHQQDDLCGRGVPLNTCPAPAKSRFW